MVTIKDAAVPHYSKHNGKIVYAVRVCPANVAIEPFTVYRRWDEFLDFSAKLANVFPSASPDPNDPSALFRRIPRLSRKVTLFPTTSTHSARRDELDLFVRHLVHLPKAVTSFPLVKEFFTVKMNGLDGRQPPSPMASHTGYFDARTQAVESLLAPSASSSSSGSSSSSSSSGHGLLKKKTSKQLRHVGSQQALRQQAAMEPMPSQTSPSTSNNINTDTNSNSNSNSIAAVPRPTFIRPTLMGKRSTPDLRRFIAISMSPTSAASSKDSFPSLPSEEELPLPSVTSSSISSESPYPSLLKFSFPPRSQPGVTPNPTAGSPSIHTKTASSSRDSSPTAPTSPSRSRSSSRQGYISSIPTSPVSVALSHSNSSDTASMRTNSTVRPGRTGSASRLASPMSFVSDISYESGRSTPLAGTSSGSGPNSARMSAALIGNSGGQSRPSIGGLRHFRSLQDIRNVIAPHPQLPLQLESTHTPSYASNPSSAASTPPQTPCSSSSATSTSGLGFSAPCMLISQPMGRARSDSKLLLSKPLPPLAKDDTVMPSSAPITRSMSGRRTGPYRMAPPLTTSTSADGIGFHIRRPSLNSIRRVQQQTPTYGPGITYHQQSPSISSISSIESGSSISLTRSQSSSGGLGLDFSSSSRESLDFSDVTASSLGSPDSSIVMSGPSTPSSATSNKGDPFDKMMNWHANDLSQAIQYGSYNPSNTAPPLPFFPTPAAYDQMTALSRRNSAAANRRRASSLHQPVLETILASPLLENDEQPTAMITVKLMTSTSNLMLKIAKSASLQAVRERVMIKCKASGIELPLRLDLAVVAAASGTDSTAKGSNLLAEKAASNDLQTASEQINLEDEQDWQVALSLATSKITLKVLDA